MAAREALFVNLAALEPLFQPWEEPIAHRIKASGGTAGAPAEVIRGRRPSGIIVANNLRSEIRQWREVNYVGASDTSRELMNYWFERPHRIKTAEGGENEFRYYFCQREAVETLIYLTEVRQITCLSQIMAEFSGAVSDIAGLGVTEDEDAWSRYAFKLATGAGKTKVMSLVVVWSYFHALRESDSPMARHFVMIAPNLTVYERLKEDFGNGVIFDKDPLIPPEWRGDWNMSVVLQDEASGAATGGVIYLTNIHRLYDTAKRKKESETYAFMGPAVSKASALDTGAALRDRITAHRRIMVLNDEAHHLWDPDSAWSDAVRYLHETIKARTGGGIVAQLDFTATPKDNKGQLFKHIVCDTPLGEAVDAGIVKTPIIGAAAANLHEEPSEDAAYRFDRHLRLGYERWRKSKEEWAKSGKKALMFVMCEDTAAADQITTRLNSDETFTELNGLTINLHTNLKGKLKKVGKGISARLEFVESEKEISDEDLKALRELSRALDSNTTHYRCIVSVLMLREGWDVRNVTTVVPLRAYTSKANILPEQTLGRGLRRMTPPGTQGANEVVTIVEHPAFASLYQQELAQEGLPIEVVDASQVPATTISIYPDAGRKNIGELEIELPTVSAAHKTLARLEGLTLDDVKKAVAKYKKLPLGTTGTTTVEYEGRHLITGEIVEKMKLYLPLLATGPGAISYYVKFLQGVCKMRSMHQVLAPLLQTFFEDLLFEQKASLFDERLVSRLGDSDVREHVLAAFMPLIRLRTISVDQRVPAGPPAKVYDWKPYQGTHSARRPALEAKHTLFNLVPCNRELEVAFAKFADNAPDVAAFAKNAGPQCLRIDYLGTGQRLAFYTPDFFVRTQTGTCYLVETKGREDRDVPRKARAAVAWCESASTGTCKWEYLYVPQGVFSAMTGNTLTALADTCSTALYDLTHEEETHATMPLFAAIAAADEAAPEYAGIVTMEVLEAMPARYRRSIEQACTLYRFMEKKAGINHAPVFTALLGALDEAAKGLIVRRLHADLPSSVPDQKAWFTPYFDGAEIKKHKDMAQNLKRTLVFNNGISPLGLLRSCLDYALNDQPAFGGVFDALKKRMGQVGAVALLETVTQINDFRNTYVAHQTAELTDAAKTLDELKMWIMGLKAIMEA
ncbi:MAG: DEAD/DEAH box helicase family protein [bacterium]|nr:DEAD/DEAH box helicase family protein [bacterium]